VVEERTEESSVDTAELDCDCENEDNESDDTEALSTKLSCSKKTKTRAVKMHDDRSPLTLFVGKPPASRLEDMVAYVESIEKLFSFHGMTNR